MPNTVNFDKGRAKIQRLREIADRPVQDVLVSEARTTAIQLAKFTVPAGTGEDAKRAGEKAVERDIAKVYATPGQAWADIFRKGPAAAFWRAFKAGEYPVAQQFLADFGAKLRGLPLEQFDGGAVHRAARNQRGRVNQRR